MISISSTASTMVVQSVVLFASSFPSIGLTRPYKRPSLLTPCCSSLPNKAGTGATDFKPMLPIVESTYATAEARDCQAAFQTPSRHHGSWFPCGMRWMKKQVTFQLYAPSHDATVETSRRFGKQ
ncbi:BnaC01g24070D [Brassica napus]|uniref:BnaC01g24070D protein n=1 Tax=Brassica napus TaxID=3708 RepID=A0A078GEG8_BRANA|nr:BnaC01g24070D [Brassica napus]